MATTRPACGDTWRPAGGAGVAVGVAGHRVRSVDAPERGACGDRKPGRALLGVAFEAHARELQGCGVPACRCAMEAHFEELQGCGVPACRCTMEAHFEELQGWRRACVQICHESAALMRAGVRHDHFACAMRDECSVCDASACKQAFVHAKYLTLAGALTGVFHAAQLGIQDEDLRGKRPRALESLVGFGLGWGGGAVSASARMTK